MVGGGGGYKINGQQLQLQLDQLAGAMTDMMMDDDEMEVNDLTFNSHLSRGGGGANMHIFHAPFKGNECLPQTLIF